MTPQNSTANRQHSKITRSPVRTRLLAGCEWWITVLHATSDKNSLGKQGGNPRLSLLRDFRAVTLQKEKNNREKEEKMQLYHVKRDGLVRLF